MYIFNRIKVYKKDTSGRIQRGSLRSGHPHLNFSMLAIKLEHIINKILSY